MPALSLEQKHRQLARAEARIRAHERGERPEWDRGPAERALKKARTKLANIDRSCTNA